MLGFPCWNQSVNTEFYTSKYCWAFWHYSGGRNPKLPLNDEMMKVVDIGMHQEGRAECDSSLYFSRVMHNSLPTVGAPGNCWEQFKNKQKQKTIDQQLNWWRHGIQRADQCEFEFALGSSLSLIFMEISIRCRIRCSVERQRRGKTDVCMLSALAHLFVVYYLPVILLDKSQRVTNRFILCSGKLRQRSEVMSLSIHGEVVGRLVDQ